LENINSILIDQPCCTGIGDVADGTIVNHE
jgi:hypothetical protein